MNTWDENVYFNAIVQHVFFECRFDNRKRQPTILQDLTTKYVLRINMKRMVSSFSQFLSFCMHTHRDTKIIYIDNFRYICSPYTIYLYIFMNMYILNHARIHMFSHLCYIGKQKRIIDILIPLSKRWDT